MLHTHPTRQREVGKGGKGAREIETCHKIPKNQNVFKQPTNQPTQAPGVLSLLHCLPTRSWCIFSVPVLPFSLCRVQLNISLVTSLLKRDPKHSSTKLEPSSRVGVKSCCAPPCPSQPIAQPGCGWTHTASTGQSQGLHHSQPRITVLLPTLQQQHCPGS